MKGWLCILIVLLLPMFLVADFEPLQPVIELEDDQYFYYDNTGGCSIAGNYLSYVVIKIDLPAETSWLEIYRSDDEGMEFTATEIANWDELPEINEPQSLILSTEDFYKKPVIMTTETGSIKVFYEDMDTGEIMVASADEYWGEFVFETAPFSDMYNDPFLWQDGEEIWSLGLEPGSMPVCSFQSYMGRMITVNSDDQCNDVSRFYGFDLYDGEVYTNSNIWIRQIGGGDNNGWPIMNRLVVGGERIIDWSTTAPAVNSAPMDDIFRGGYLENYVEKMGEIDLPETAEEVRMNGLVLENSENRDILFAKIDGTTATCRYADIEYEEMEFTVYNSYPDPLHPEWAIGDSIWTNVVQVPHIVWDEETFDLAVEDGSVFCWSKLWIEGVVNGKMTWASADTVFITDNIFYESVLPGEEVPYGCEDMFGLISEKSILIKYKHWDPDTEEIESSNCDDVYLYGSYAALGVADPNSVYPGYEEGIFSYEYQHPHGSTPDFIGVSPYTGNDTLFNYIDLHKYIMPPAEGYTGDPAFILHSGELVPGYSCCGYPYEDPDYESPNVAPYGTDMPFYNPVWPESSEDIVFERGAIYLFGSVAQRRVGFSHRSGTDPSNHDNNCSLDNGEHLYGGTHGPTGYDKYLRYDERLNREIYPPDFVKVENYFKQFKSNCSKADFGMNEIEELGEKDVKSLYYPLLLTANNDSEEYVAIMYQEPGIVEIVFTDDGVINKEPVELEDWENGIKEVYRENNFIFIETEEKLYRHELGSSEPAEVVEDILDPEEWHGIEWNSTGTGLLIAIGEGDDNINIEKYNTETNEFEQLVNYDLPSAELLNDLYNDLDFNYHYYGNGEVIANFLQHPETGEYYQKLYQMKGEISILSGDEDNIPPAINEMTVYPNPFNPDLTVRYSLEEFQEVNISIYNLRGEKVTTLCNERLATGKGEKVWNGKNDQGESCSSGIYFIRLRTGEQQIQKKAILLK